MFNLIRGAFVALCLVSTNACDTIDDRADRIRAREGLSSDDYLRSKSLEFRRCVADYAISRRDSGLTATELAQAGVSACGPELRVVRSALTSQAYITVDTVNAVAAQLVDLAKGDALRAVADARTNKKP